MSQMGCIAGETLQTDLDKVFEASRTAVGARPEAFTSRYRRQVTFICRRDAAMMDR